MATKKPVKTKAAQSAERQADSAKKVAKAITVETVATQMASLGVNVNKALTNIEQEMFGKVQELEQLDQAIEAKKAELETLHEINAAAIDLDTLRNDLEEFRQNSLKEKDRTEAEHKQFQSDLETQRKREQAEWQYQNKKKQQEEQDKFEQRIKEITRQSNEAEEEKEKIWKSREEVLAAKEKEFEELKARVAAFPEELKKEVARAEAILGNSMKKDYTHQTEVQKLQFENDRKSLAQEVASQKAQIVSLEQQVNNLRAEVTSKSEQLVSLTGRVVDASAGRQALEALKESTSREVPSKK